MTRVKVVVSRYRWVCGQRVSIDDEYIDCPNSACDIECNVCMGRGSMSNPYWVGRDEYDDDADT